MSLSHVFKLVIWHFKLSGRKIFGLIIRYTPYKVLVIEIVSVFVGIFVMWRRLGQQQEISAFAKYIGSRIPGRLFYLKYYFQQVRDKLWEIAYFEATESLKKYFLIEGTQELYRALKEGKGAILVGPHYGPTLYSFQFRQMNIDFKIASVKIFFNKLNELSKLGIKFSNHKLIHILSETATSSEKELVRHLKEKQGAIVIHADVMQKGNRGCVDVNMFGHWIKFSYFPFKLALKYDTPVFFFSFKKISKGGYSLNFVPIDSFSTPEEGVYKFASCLEAQLKLNPYPWDFVPHFRKQIRER